MNAMAAGATIIVRAIVRVAGSSTGDAVTQGATRS
jgi:hypothetical protein